MESAAQPCVAFSMYMTYPRSTDQIMCARGLSRLEKKGQSSAARGIEGFGATTVKRLVRIAREFADT
jgi:hypothetical protein